LSLSTLADQYCPTICRPILNRVQQSPIGKRIVSGTFWSVIGNGFGKMFTFIAMVLVARILGIQLYGELGLIRSATDIFIGLSSFGVGTAATTYIAELLSNDKQRVGRIIGLCYLFTLITCIGAGAFLYFAAPFICESSILRAPHLTGELRISIVILIFMTFMGTQAGVMSGFQDFRGQAFATIVSSMLSIPLYIGGSYYFGIYGAIIGIGVVSLVNVVANSIFIYRNTIKHQVIYNFREAWRELSILWNLSLPIFLCGIMFCIFTAIYRLKLVSSPNGFYELGIYVAVTQIEMIVYYIPIQIGAVVLPLLSEQHGKKDIKKFFYLSNLSIGFNMIVTLVAVLPVIIFASPIMFLFGDTFTEGSITLIVVCFGLVFHAGLRGLYNECVNRHQMWKYFVMSFVSYLFQFILLSILLNRGFGALGMAIAYFFSYVVYFVGTFVLIRISSCYRYS
jgi:O-antigen/teichoic acid export membrane protein